jgi:lipoic acid synthetase
MQTSENHKRLPPWFKIRLTTTDRFMEVRRLIRTNKLNTVCRSAACPNQTECWNSGTATFMILGNVCSRSCRFCNIPKGIPEGLDVDEPDRVAHAVSVLKLKYVVITSVTRDDLSDGGASIFSKTMRAIRAQSPDCRIEVLIPDFQGSESSLHSVIEVSPDVLNHNIETVPSLYSSVRPHADYRRSIELLSRAGRSGVTTKTGLMLGLGERSDEVINVMHDLCEIGCSILTLGQYLRPGKTLRSVEKYYHPDEFAAFRDHALSMGFHHVVAGPLVRSSYHAEHYGGRGAGRVNVF